LIAKLIISFMLFTGGSYEPPVSVPSWALCPQYWQMAIDKNPDAKTVYESEIANLQ